MSELAVDDLPISEVRSEQLQQYLSFVLAGELYAVDILRVVEIRGWTPVTAVPNTQPYIKGILNLRGIVLPVFDLRDRFQLAPLPYDPTTVVIIVKVESRHGQKMMGIVVDSVRSVVDIHKRELKERPDCGAAINSEFILNIASVGSEMVMVLDIDAMLLEPDEMLGQEEGSHE